PGSAWSGYTMVSRVEEADTATLRYPVNEWGLTRDGVLLNGLDPRTTPFTRITVQVKCFRNERITINRMDLASRVIQRWWRLTRAGGTSWGIFTSGGSNSWLDMIREYASAEMARRRQKVYTALTATTRSNGSAAAGIQQFALAEAQSLKSSDQ
ncbi:hypothetical protein FOZ63_010094, partial [Perkinsus olseni]